MKKNYIFVETLGPLIQQYRPRVIVETGTHSGRSGYYMVTEALKHHPDVEYHGFDLFDMANESTHQAEINGKGVGNYDKAQSKFQRVAREHPGFRWTLTRGFTTDSFVTPIRADLAYIDGGHSTETVLHDFGMVKTSGIVVFDDYDMDSVQQAIRQAGIEQAVTVHRGLKHWQAIWINQ